MWYITVIQIEKHKIETNTQKKKKKKNVVHEQTLAHWIQNKIVVIRDVLIVG